jgi:hypothetical protein
MIILITEVANLLSEQKRRKLTCVCVAKQISGLGFPFYFPLNKRKQLAYIISRSRKRVDYTLRTKHIMPDIILDYQVLIPFSNRVE